MSAILTIDTSTDRTSVGLVDGGTVIASAHHDDPLGHSEVLPRLVAQLLEREHDISEVVIGMGPGPFTGLRAGIAFGRAFAFARSIPWIGVCSLDAIALGRSEEQFLVATDARRKELFYAEYQSGLRISEPMVAVHQAVKALNLPTFGEGAVKYGFAQQGEQAYPDPLALAQLRNGARYSEPLYVRRPDAYPAPKGVTFRPLTIMDAVQLQAMEKVIYKGEEPWSLGQFKEELSTLDRYYIGALFEGELIAYAGIMVAGDVCDILTLSVMPEHRRKGIARELLKRMIDWSRNRKVDAIMLEMRVGNTEAEPLYLAHGFRKIAERADYYGPGKPATIMRKELTS